MIGSADLLSVLAGSASGSGGHVAAHKCKYKTLPSSVQVAERPAHVFASWEGHLLLNGYITTMVMMQVLAVYHAW